MQAVVEFGLTHVILPVVSSAVGWYAASSAQLG